MYIIKRDNLFGYVNGRRVCAYFEGYDDRFGVPSYDAKEKAMRFETREAAERFVSANLNGKIHTVCKI